MEKEKLTMDDDGITMNEIIVNQFSISEQEDAYAALEAKYNNAEEAIEQDAFAAQLDGVEDMIESVPDFIEELEDEVMEENYIEEDEYDSWGSIDDNPYYDDNLDMDQQSLEFWDSL